jgi:hypothetical protein
MGDITSVKVLYVKAGLFVFGEILASAILLLEMPTVKATILLALAVWCFCRAYYFVFYVIEHYIDDGYKFSGLWSFVVYQQNKKAIKHNETNL